MEEGIKGFKSLLLAEFGVTGKDIRTFSPLALAFVGDAVYSLVIRTVETEKGNRQAEKLHRDTSKIVSAAAQSRAAALIMPLLTDEEAAVFRRGRNAAPASHARSASIEEYAQATGLEAVCGWLYLKGEEQRLLYLIRAGLGLTPSQNEMGEES